MTQQLGVYKAIINIMAELAKSGISKDRKNQQQGYVFRGVDDMYNKLAPLLSKNNLCILPTVLDRHTTERQTQKGGVLFYTTVKTKFTFVCAEDGSTQEVTFDGEAMDTADKSTNKAMSAAYKYMCMQTFCIPTKGDNDPDATTPDPLKPIFDQGKAKPAAKQSHAASTPPAPAILPDEIIEKLYEAKSKEDLKNLCVNIGNKNPEYKNLLNGFYIANREKMFQGEGN
ncbi:hypothetical protein AAIR98_000877 [Elusimicrobium simillimum]|uniref:ERF family protein n=1 Tax=Elusimicrobium simillimum TaxID=3143438 RepID=UPI003C6EF68A